MESIYSARLGQFQAWLRAQGRTEGTAYGMFNLARRVVESGADLTQTTEIDYFIDTQKLSVRAAMQSAWRCFVDYLRDAGVAPLPALPSAGLRGRPPRRADRVDVLILALHEAGVPYEVMVGACWRELRSAGREAMLLPMTSGIASIPRALLRDLHRIFFPGHETPPPNAPLIPRAPGSVEPCVDWALRASGMRARNDVNAGRVKGWEAPPSDNFD